jgi:hypothetical protein
VVDEYYNARLRIEEQGNLGKGMVSFSNHDQVKRRGRAPCREKL